MGDGHLSTIWIVDARQPNPKRESRCRIEAGIDCTQLLETAQQETGCYEQNQCQCDLDSHEEVPHAVTTPTWGAPAPALAQRLDHTSEAKQRYRPEYRRRDETEDERERQYECVESDFVEAGQVHRSESDEH